MTQPDPTETEVVLLARRLGLTLDDRDLALSIASYRRNRELLTQLSHALPPELEPALTFVPAGSVGAQ